jgi:transcriptional regulator with XRE-family HTH domain
MATGKRRYHPINKEEVLRLQRAMGLTVEQLALAAGLDWKTVNKWLNGEVKGGLISKVTKLAKALGVTADRIIEGPVTALNAAVEHADTHMFDMTIQLRGNLSDLSAAGAFPHATAALLQHLAACGVNVIRHQTNLNVLTSRDGDWKRIVTVVYGMFENGKPFWVFTAVRPEAYPLFVNNYKAGLIDMYNFDIYGEMLLFGEGEAPPDDAVLKIATMFQTTPAALMEGMGSLDRDLKRKIVLVLGMLKNGNRSWLFAAIRPEMYSLFLTRYKADELYIHHLESLGEILLSGEGEMPPDDVTRKVAAMYNTTPDEFVSYIDE